VIAALLSAVLAQPTPARPRADDLLDGEIRYTLPTLTHRSDFRARDTHPAGTYLYYQRRLPQADQGHYEYIHVVSEFRFTRDDGLVDVIMIETSPVVSSGLFFRVSGAEGVTLAYGCDADRVCQSEHTVAVIWANSSADYVISSDDFAGRVEPSLMRMLRAGRALHRQMLRFYDESIRTVSKAYVIDDEVSLPWPERPWSYSQLERLVRSRDKLQGQLLTPPY
jgi:hypothetical protein